MTGRWAVTIVVAVTLLLSAGMGWLIVEGTRGEPGLPAWQGPVRIDVYRGSQYVFISWDFKTER